MGSLTREAVAVFGKDWRSEGRTKSALYAVFLFALTSLLVVTLNVRTEGDGLTLNRQFQAGDTALRQVLLAGLLWIILLFSAISGLARSFVKEEEQRTVLALRLTARPLAVYFGKLLFNVALLLAVGAVVTPLFVLFSKVQVLAPGLLVAEVAIGCATMAAAVTILGAIVARAGGSMALFAALGFPLLLFVMVLAINGTAGAFAGGAKALQARNEILGFVSYLVAMVTGSAMLFDQVWQA